MKHCFRMPKDKDSEEIGDLVIRLTCEGCSGFTFYHRLENSFWTPSWVRKECALWKPKGFLRFGPNWYDPESPHS